MPRHRRGYQDQCRERQKRDRQSGPKHPATRQSEPSGVHVAWSPGCAEGNQSVGPTSQPAWSNQHRDRPLRPRARQPHRGSIPSRTSGRGGCSLGQCSECDTAYRSCRKAGAPPRGRCSCKSDRVWQVRYLRGSRQAMPVHRIPRFGVCPRPCTTTVWCLARELVSTFTGLTARCLGHLPPTRSQTFTRWKVWRQMGQLFALPVHSRKQASCRIWPQI